MIKYRIHVDTRSSEEIGLLACIKQRSDPNNKHWFEFHIEDTRELAEHYAMLARLAGFETQIIEFDPELEQTYIGYKGKLTKQPKREVFNPYGPRVEVVNPKEVE